ncbi:hypothetical protein BU26DRAFT_572813 [Trematosphaeria pertusa]|uniref:Uncharacterized protein n=1 Tax=Trematosphaeria pertusa TaxID=390896 RepID=A0A6A6HSM0_9PLEO|nr:uncharacterized protein BU26DRAFT_572813 [Trematosphaeria pertusa]KAF2240430.1 hypothetical protein BU26DRAFT_572813 [Trematosphaeria pertusa]
MPSHPSRIPVRESRRNADSLSLDVSAQSTPTTTDPTDTRRHAICGTPPGAESLRGLETAGEEQQQHVDVDVDSTFVAQEWDDDARKLTPEEISQLGEGEGEGEGGQQGTEGPVAVSALAGFDSPTEVAQQRQPAAARRFSWTTGDTALFCIRRLTPASGGSGSSTSSSSSGSSGDETLPEDVPLPPSPVDSLLSSSQAQDHLSTLSSSSTAVEDQHAPPPPESTHSNLSGSTLVDDSGGAIEDTSTAGNPSVAAQPSTPLTPLTPLRRRALSESALPSATHSGVGTVVSEQPPQREATTAYETAPRRRVERRRRVLGLRNLFLCGR